MVADVAFQEFSHEAVDRASCCTDDLQYLRAIASLIENPLKGLELAPDAFAAQYQLLFVPYHMTHLRTNNNMAGRIIYTYGGMYVKLLFACEFRHVAARGSRYRWCGSWT